ncbi:uncharacterized protein LOC106084802 [Stomoxys calcitrans]|uniref:Uncharacterized protein n=1 Tax=Stomoxys calcitrans TaxID=35570 RepID=A0A1I8P6Q7_STOCA|nr:uncharacterized protein LOC106084802 [Stomoxys calcitrans]
MVSYKLVGILLAMVSCLLASGQTASTSKERLAGLYVKDSTNGNGELRFLASNAQINQLINQKQEVLEQLRPTTTGTGNVNPIIINTATATATATGTAGTAVTGTGGIVTTGGNNNLNTIITQGSPIAALLPQIIGQTLVRGGPSGNRRRVSNRRRGNRRPGNRQVLRGRRRNRPQVIVARPQRG